GDGARSGGTRGGCSPPVGRRRPRGRLEFFAGPRSRRSIELFTDPRPRGGIELFSGFGPVGTLGRFDDLGLCEGNYASVGQRSLRLATSGDKDKSSEPNAVNCERRGGVPLHGQTRSYNEERENEGDGQHQRSAA